MFNHLADRIKAGHAHAKLECATTERRLSVKEFLQGPAGGQSNKLLIKHISECNVTLLSQRMSSRSNKNQSIDSECKSLQIAMPASIDHEAYRHVAGPARQ